MTALTKSEESIAESSRLDYLDAVRAFALLLGVFFHASLSFLPVYIGWAVMDVSTSRLVSLFVHVSHSFRMELFFLIAGFFSHMTFHSKGTTAFVKSRVFRIVIPFIAAWFILKPMIVSGWIMGAESMQGSVDIINALQGGLSTLNKLPNELFTGTHLWFLYYLILITTSLLILRFVLNISARVYGKVTGVMDAWVGWLSQSKIILPIIATPTSVCLWFMSHWGMDTPEKTLMPQLPVFFIYFGFFAFGWLINRQKDVIENLSQLNWTNSLLCLVSIVVTAILSDYSMKWGHPYYQYLKALFCFGYAIMMWSLVFLCIGVFKRVFNKPNEIIRYLADASYWLYLIHLPIVVWLQVAVAELAFHWSIKLVLISLLTIALSLLTYDVFVRNTFIGVVLNGRRKSRFLLRSLQKTNANAERKGVYPC